MITLPPFPRVGTLFSKGDMSPNAIASLARFHGWFGMATFHFFYKGNAPLPAARLASGQVMPLPGQITYLKSYNPNIILTLYAHACLFNPTNDFTTYNDTNDWTNAFTGTTHLRPVDLRYALCLAGTTLNGSILNTDTTIVVTSSTPFVVNCYALLTTATFTNPEIVKVTAIPDGTHLTITRAQVTEFGTYTAQAYANADIIRPIIGNLGSVSSPSWNITTNCPTYTSAYNYTDNFNQWLARFRAEKTLSDSSGFTSGGQGSMANDINGIFMDNWVDTATAILVPTGTQAWNTNADINGTNTATGLTNANWLAGMQDQATKLRTLLGNNFIITGNSGGSAGNFNRWLNGGMVEGCDHTGASGFIGNQAACQTFIDAWINNSIDPAITIYNGSSNRGGLTVVGAPGTANSVGNDYQAMRFNLALALTTNDPTGGPFYIYDEEGFTGTGGGSHSTAWWYDEYAVNVALIGASGSVGVPDGATTGWLGNPLGPRSTPTAGGFVRYFQNGCAIANNSGGSFAFTLTSAHHRIDATGAGGQAPAINAGGASGTSFTVPNQDGLILIRG